MDTLGGSVVPGILRVAAYKGPGGSTTALQPCFSGIRTSGGRFRDCAVLPWFRSVNPRNQLHIYSAALGRWEFQKTRRWPVLRIKRIWDHGCPASVGVGLPLRGSEAEVRKYAVRFTGGSDCGYRCSVALVYSFGGVRIGWHLASRSCSRRRLVRQAGLARAEGWPACDRRRNRHCFVCSGVGTDLCELETAALSLTCPTVLLASACGFKQRAH